MFKSRPFGFENGSLPRRAQSHLHLGFQAHLQNSGPLFLKFLEISPPPYKHRLQSIFPDFVGNRSLRLSDFRYKRASRIVHFRNLSDIFKIVGVFQIGGVIFGFAEWQMFALPVGKA